MTHKLYKKGFTLLTIFFLGTSFAQKFDKKFTENFKVNKDVEIVINASNSDINVTTWPKNEVQVEAFIEIEGLSKTEAEEYFKKWNFEALGNKKKVQIISKGSNTFGLKNDIVFFNNMDFKIDFPEIEMPNFDSIVIPDMDFNFDFNFQSLDNLEENMKKDGKYSFEYHNDDEHIVIKTKKEWEEFKKSKKYKELKEELKNSDLKIKNALKNSKQQLKSINKKQVKEALYQAKLQIKNIDKEQLRVGLLKAKEAFKNMNFSFNSNSDDLTINGKKVKIKKRIEIKVPKAATFDLNTRHCKVKLPNTVASGSIKYGVFNANDLLGGKLTVDYAPVNINSLNACTLFLNNVTDAKIASVSNSVLSSNSSGVKITKVNENVDLSSKFGELLISNITSNYQSFKLNLDYTESKLNLSKISNLVYNIGDKSPLFPEKSSIKSNISDLKSKDINGNFTIKTKDNNFLIQGKYSQLTIKE